MNLYNNILMYSSNIITNNISIIKNVKHHKNIINNNIYDIFNIVKSQFSKFSSKLSNKSYDSCLIINTNGFVPYYKLYTRNDKPIIFRNYRSRIFIKMWYHEISKTPHKK